MDNLLTKIESFDWDGFNTEKIRNKHGIEPYECEELFFNEPFIAKDEKHSQTEDRYYALGMTMSNKLFFVVFTIRKNKIRVISARPMSKKEREVYHEKVKKNT